MAWKRDWLYHLVLNRIRDVWTRAIDDADSIHRGDSPRLLLIHECAGADIAQAICSEAILRSWKYAGNDFDEQVNQSYPPINKARWEETQARLDPYFDQGVVRFYIFEDRKRIVFIYVLGPNYGRGCVYAVLGQGASGKLYPMVDSVSCVA